jgi:outer membrane protein TolC
MKEMKKINKMKKIFCTVTICVFFLARAMANDSTKLLLPEEFFSLVNKYHPLAKLASIQVDKAHATLTSTRGGFDPVLGMTVGNKTFDNINYYQRNVTELVIPTWYGIEMYAGIEYQGGSRNDPRESSGKTSFAGFGIPLAKNLLMDKRRATLLQAKNMLQASEQEKRMMLNNLMNDAAEAYWQWAGTYLIYKSYTDVIELNRKRVSLVNTAFRNGERPAIDTIEALVQLQYYEYQQNQARLNWQTAGLHLSTFLWKDNNQQYDIPEDVLPGKKLEDLIDGVNFPELQKLVDDAVRVHPELSIFNYKLKEMNIQKKLKFQELLPKLDIKYSLLGKGYDFASVAAKSSFDNNYRFSINFSMPLRLSEGRGQYKMTKLKISETKLQQTQKETIVINKVKSYYAQLVNYKTQVAILKNIYNNNRQLQKSEEFRFFNGESSLFLVNSRENKTLESAIKLAETAISYNKTDYALRWASGILWKY